jgi:hypothetical protein
MQIAFMLEKIEMAPLLIHRVMDATAHAIYLKLAATLEV